MFFIALWLLCEDSNSWSLSSQIKVSEIKVSKTKVPEINAEGATATAWISG
ncbi:hypothetical protein GCM10008022_30100 [Paenibacillus hunanensis]|nr:hypothetical protein GCM10008022_30100 [Paenibacillus hunanensis]